MLKRATLRSLPSFFYCLTSSLFNQAVKTLLQVLKVKNMAPIISYRRFATFFLGAHFGKGTSFAVWPFGSRNHQKKVWNWLFWPFSGRSQTVAATVMRLKIKRNFRLFFEIFISNFYRCFFKKLKNTLSLRGTFVRLRLLSLLASEGKKQTWNLTGLFPFKWVIYQFFEQIPTLREN